jgi:hypothetical protein
MFKKRTALIVTGMMLFSSVAFATNWVLLDSSDKAELYVDKSSVEFEHNGTASLWVKYKYITPTNNADFLPAYTISGFVRKDIIDCKNNSYTSDLINWYEVGGKAVYVQKMSSTKNNINPGTLGETEMQFVCTTTRKVITQGPAF